MQRYYTFDQLVEQLPEICKDQRQFLQLTQADIVERLEKETGVRKDQSKISMFESGKIVIPDFLSDYCSILDICFPAPSYRKEYLMEKEDVTREAIVNEMHYMKNVVTDIMLDIGYDIEEDHDEIDIISVEKYYCVRVSIPRVCEDDIAYLTNNYIFAFMAAEDGPRLCGRMQVYSIFPVAYVNIPMDREILMYTDGETANLGEMGMYMHNVMSKYIKKKTKHSCEEIYDDLDLLPEELSFELMEHRILLISDIYVYESDRKKGCFTAMMKYLYQWFGQGSTWICNTSPVYLKEDEYEYREMKVGYDYPEKTDSDVQSFVDTNINIFKKFGNIEIVILSNMTSGEFPYVIHSMLN